jgi:sirohydrochlorin cobaltochelatase
VVQQDFSDAALVIIGHGSTRHPGAGAPVYQHARELRRRGLFAEVREAFWKQSPGLADVVDGLQRPRVFFVPLFASEGYFSDRLIPSKLGFAAGTEGGGARVKREGERTLYYCRPVGAHPAMSQVLLARAREVFAQAPGMTMPAPREMTLFIAGHGTMRNGNSRKTIERQADILRELGLYAGVWSVFMEEEPGIGRVYDLAGTRHVVIVPFFIGEGPHPREDVPVLLGGSEGWIRERLAQGMPAWTNPTERHGRLVWYAASVGDAPQLSDLIMELVNESVLRGREAQLGTGG